MYKSTDYLAGAFVLISLTLMLWITIVLGGHQSALKELIFGTKNTTVQISFEQISGLEINHGVKIQGHKFGKVSDIQIKDGLILVTVKLGDQVEIHQDYKVEIKDESILGGKSVYIDVGTKTAPIIENLYTEDATVLKGKTAGNLMSEGGNLLSDNREDIRDIVKNIKDISEKIKAVAEKVNTGEGVVGRLINDQEMGERLKLSLADLQTMISKVKNGEGFLGKLINDDQLYKDVSKIIKEAQSALEDMREQAPITTFSGTLMGAF